MRHVFSPRYKITTKMLLDLSRIEVIRVDIAHCPVQPKEEYRLKHEAVLSMVHHSTAIEGNTLNQAEVRNILEGKSVLAPEREIYEVKNYKKALNFIAGRKSPQILPADVLKIHKLAMSKLLTHEKSGQFRKEPVYVVRRTPISQEVRYVAPDHRLVPKLVKNLCDWINKAHKENVSPVLIAGIAHAEIAAIHPFSDGNGRTARLLATLILYTEQYDFRKLFALDNFYNMNRPAYYKAIHLGKTYNERSQSDLTEWLEYFTRGFLNEMELVLDKIRPFLYRGKVAGGKVVLTKNEIRILDFLQEMRHITSRDVEEILSVTKRTAQRVLVKLIQKKMVKRRGGRKNATYHI